MSGLIDTSAPGTLPLSHDWIAARIPHSGDMCLLNSIKDWSASHILCDATSHRLPNNPLRLQNQLGSVCGVEYAAQAMAVHGALIAPADDTHPRIGYLVSIRNTQIEVPRLDNIKADLQIHATCLSANEHNLMYEFKIMADQQTLLSGRAAVVLNTV
ncbi:MAG TPA: hydroxymyristoyl-ACP dehydratase [Burkholderiaceae bacterium]|nr:hydroxymyristoyl-ACP dehydratase [Burkholderiaceae bacterium]